MKRRFDWKRAMLGALLPVLTAANVGTAGTFQAADMQDLEKIEADIRASQFLSRATFGPTKAEIAALSAEIRNIGARAAFEAWIETQFDTQVTETTYHHALAKEMIHYDGFLGDSASPPDYGTGNPTTNYRHYAWWHAAIAAPDQLRQRMAWALAQIFVINEISAGTNNRTLLDPPNNEPRFLGVVDYYDMLVKNAFGNYRETLEDVTYHPIMGVFLSHRGNRKAPDPVNGPFPDENYAREIMQLFSIGLYEIKRNGDYVTDKKTRDPVPAYDNDDIESFARVFTGLDYYGGSQNFHEPMDRYEGRHDTDEKVLLKGTVLPAGQTVEQDIDGALDNLFHHPNTAPFISRLLIQRLVKSNPSSRYIDAVATAFEDNGFGERGDFKAVLKEILLNPEAMDSYKFGTNKKNLTLTVEGGGTEHSRLQEPVVRYAAFLRAFDASPVVFFDVDGDEVIDEVDYPYFSIGDRSSQLNQEVYRSPSVFNFYRPDHVPQGELQHYRPQGRFPNKTVSAPEFQIMTSVAANTLANRLRINVLNQRLFLSVQQYTGGSGTAPYIPLRIKLDFEDEELLAADDQNPNDGVDTGPDVLLQHLNILMCHGSLSDAARSDLRTILGGDPEAVPPIDPITTDPVIRAEGAILALLTAPDCAVHE